MNDETAAYPYRPEVAPPVPLASSIPDSPSARGRFQPSGPYHWFSVHDHVCRLPQVMAPHEWKQYLAWDREALAHRAIFESGLSALFHSMLDDGNFESVVRWAALLKADIRHTPNLILAETLDDLKRARDTGRTAIFLGLEGAAAIGTDLDHVEVLYGLGIRSMGLTYNFQNTLGSGLADPTDLGLTSLGRDVVKLMNALGMVVDIAHVGDRTALQAIEVATRPVVISHAGARGLWPTRRMKPDDVIKATAGTGGVIGIEAAPNTTLTLTNRRHTLDTVMAHFEYCLNLVGVEHVAFGPDTVFGDHVGLHHLDSMPTMEVPPHDDITQVEGVENPRESFSNIDRWLSEHGYSENDRAKVLGQNIERVLNEVLIP